MFGAIHAIPTLPFSHLQAYADGACLGNPGPGGWGILFTHIRGDSVTSTRHFGGEPGTTNNRMELTAVIQALQQALSFDTKDIPAKEYSFAIFTDSKYVQQGITGWITDWKARGWKTSAKKPVKNQDLWMQLDQLFEQSKQHFLQTSVRWVKGHNGDPGNEEADRLANQGVEQFGRSAGSAQS